MFELTDVKIALNNKTLVNLSQCIGPGEVLTIMGASGSGKSTLLSWIVGQLADSFEASGKLVLNGRNITTLATEARRIGLMYQDPLLFPHMTVAENIAFGMGQQRRNSKEKIDTMLGQVGLSGFADRSPNRLSGGQQSRVALLRLLANEPEAVLLDEPFSSLDEVNRKNTRDFVMKQLKDANIPVILVTHDTKEASAVGGKMISLTAAC